MFNILDLKIIFLIMDMDNFSWNINYCYVCWYICKDNCCSIDFSIFFNFNWINDLRMC